MMAELPQFSVFKTVLMYSIFILLAPIATFFVTKIFFFEAIVGTSSVSSNVWSAVVAIAVLHVALGLFIFRAYNDAGKVKPTKDDKVD